MRAAGWRIATGLLACACSGTPPARQGSAPPSPAGEALATAQPSPAPQDVVGIEELQAIAPELSETSAARLIGAFGQAGQPPETVAEAGLATASQGFRTLEEGAAREIGVLLDEAYATLTAADRTGLGHYLDRVRSGRTNVDEAREGHRLFARAVLALDEGRRRRLQALFEKGVLAGLQYETDARARTEAAQPVEGGVVPSEPTRTRLVAGPRKGTVPAGAVPSPPPYETGGAPKGRGEAYWRSEAQRRQARVATLERELAEAEAAAARFVYSSDGSSGQIGFGTPTPNPFYVARTKANARIAQLRSQLSAARQHLADLDDDARRDYAMPGWTR